MADLTGKRFYISTEEAEYFESRSMKCLDSPPTSGTHKVGDIVISSTQADGLFGWVCTIEGTPGTWSEIGFGGDISAEDLYGVVFQGDDIDNIDYTLESKYDKKIGSLSSLKTDDKSSLVSAINELKLLYDELKGLLDSLNKE